MSGELKSKQQAVAAMRRGEKVTHRYFSPEEWMTMQGNMIILEDGVSVSQEEFWADRATDVWDYDYSIWAG